MRVYKFLDAHFGMKTLREKRLKISLLEDLNDPFELLPFEMMSKKRRQEMNQARKQWSGMHGMLCFSSTWHDPVTWAHYSDKHRGLCLGFEIPRQRVEKVKYASQRLPFPERLEPKVATAWSYTKYKNWFYEKEVRCFTNLDTQSKRIALLRPEAVLRCRNERIPRSYFS
jgi:hypothetical protein